METKKKKKSVKPKLLGLKPSRQPWYRKKFETPLRPSRGARDELQEKFETPLKTVKDRELEDTIKAQADTIRLQDEEIQRLKREEELLVVQCHLQQNRFQEESDSLGFWVKGLQQWIESLNDPRRIAPLPQRRLIYEKQRFVQARGDIRKFR